ncbi:MAG: hypothetical protein LW630_06885 [Saprospiraceae bacterium]|nr:hypothetical protein [Saprospiraceae bacterium]
MRCVWLFPLFLFMVVFQAAGLSQEAERTLAKVVSLYQPEEEWNESFRTVQNLSLPWLEKVEFRSELDRLLFSRQEFLARASFQLPSIRRAEVNRLKSYTAWKTSERNTSWFPVLLQTYQSLVNFQGSTLEVKGLQNEYLLLMKEDSLYRQILGSGREADIPDFIGLQSEIQDVLSQLTIARRRWIEYARLVGADTLVPKPDLYWLSPEQMKAVVDSVGIGRNSSADGEIDYLEASFRLARAESKRWLDFVQTRYIVRDDLLLQNRFSVGVGLIIPWNGSTRLKLADLQFRQIQLKEEERANSFWRTKRIQQYKADFASSFAAFEILSGQQEDGNIQSLKLKYLQSGKLDPVKWLRMERYELRRNATILKELQRLWKTYIDIMDVSGMMYHPPFINYLYGKTIPMESGR